MLWTKHVKHLNTIYKALNNNKKKLKTRSITFNVKHWGDSWVVLNYLRNIFKTEIDRDREIDRSISREERE